MEDNTLLVYVSYPNVLFDHAINHGSIKFYFLSAQKVLNVLLQDNGKLNNFLKDLTISKEVRKQMIDKIFKGNIESFFLWFLYIIIDFNRCNYLERIIKNFLNQCDKEFGMNYAKIYSPYPLNDKQKNKLIKAIKQYYKMDVKLLILLIKT